MVRTALCELTVIECPIVQDMAWLATTELAIAVSEASGLATEKACDCAFEIADLNKDIKSSNQMIQYIISGADTIILRLSANQEVAN